MDYLTYLIPVLAFLIAAVLCVLASTPGSTRDEIDELALLHDIERRRDSGAV